MSAKTARFKSTNVQLSKQKGARICTNARPVLNAQHQNRKNPITAKFPAVQQHIVAD